MIKGVLIDLVFNSVNGGRPNADSSVQREDVAALIPAAVNYVMTNDYWGNLRAEGDKEIPMGIVTEIELTTIVKDSRGFDSIEFTTPLINPGGHSGIRYIQDDCGNNYYPRSSSVGKSAWDSILDGYQQYSYIKDKIRLYGKPPLVNKVIAGVVVDCSLLSDEDELPIPTGMEPQVLDLMLGFFNNQRMQPKDYIIDGKDPINAT